MQELCNAAHLFYGALAAWAFVQEDSFWKEVGRAGDASPLDQELLGRLQSAPSAGEPGDLAFVAMPVPASGDRVGLLILQPGDRTEADPWVVLGGATERIARIVRTRENGGATEAINLLDLQEKLLSLRGHQSTQSPRVLFDPLGHWLMGSDNFYDELRLSCSPGADLLSHGEALGGTPEQLVEVGAKTVSLQSQFRGRQFSLKAGIHAGKVECYILKVDSRERKANEARNQESPC